MKKILKLMVVIIVITILASCTTGNIIDEPTVSPIPSNTAKATITPVETVKPTNTPKVTPSATPVASETPTPTPIPTPTPTPVIETPTPSQTPKPSEAPREIIRKDIPVIKGIYLSAGSVAYRENLDRWIKLADETEINAFIINVKNDSGTLVYDSDNEMAKASGAISPMFNIEELTSELHEHGIYAIARVVCFKDNIIPIQYPELALKDENGDLFLENAGGGRTTTWLNAASEEAGAYLVDIAKEVIDKGFDEVQFDYIRFPGRIGVDYSFLEEEPEYYIRKFMNYASDTIPDYTLSADIFGIVCLASTDSGGIGQTLEVFSDNVDVISPMIYPSHYANSSNRTMGNGIGSRINGTLFEYPDLDPYGVVYNTLVIAKDRMEAADFKATMRPYIQGFTASYLPTGYWMEYTAEQFKLQIKAVEDAGFDSWIFWDATPDYTIDQFESNIIE